MDIEKGVLFVWMLKREVFKQDIGIFTYFLLIT